MTVASYTKTVAFVGEALPVKEQNANIKNAARQRGWEIAYRYSDTETTPELQDGFLKMKEDAISGLFECLMFQSLNCLGPATYVAHDLLSQVFVPMGICFWDLEDDYCSADHSDEETLRFLRQKYQKCHHDILSNNAKMATQKKRKIDSPGLYGYCVDENQNIIDFDNEVYDTLKEIFSLALGGMRCSSIASTMNERNIPNPKLYMTLKKGMRRQAISYLWSYKIVQNLLLNPLYMGKWEHEKDGIVITDQCPAYITETEYNQLLRQREAVDEKMAQTQRFYNPFSDMVFDKETGIVLYTSQSYYNDIRRYYFSVVDEEHQRYKKKSIPFDKVMDAVVAAISDEKSRALKVKAKLLQQNGKRWREDIISDRKKEYHDLLCQMMKVVDGLMPDYNIEKADGLSKEELEQKFIELDARMKSFVDESTQYKALLSENNPWIKTFASFDSNAFDDNHKAAKMIEKIYIYRFEKVEVIMKLQEEKSVFPKEWMED